MPTGWKRTWTGWTGRRASSSCSATGSAGAPGPRSISSSARERATTACRRRTSTSLAIVERIEKGFPQTPGGRRAADLYDPARHALRRHVHGDRPGASAGRRLDQARAGRGGRGVLRQAAAKATWTAPIWPRKRPACSPAPTPSIRSTDKAIPIWVADYVLVSYGTGAIMAVPAHDTRDFEFAQEFGLPIVPVVDPGGGAGRMRDDVLAGRSAFIADGTAIHSGRFDGLTDVRVQAEHRRLSPEHGARPGGGQLQAPRLALQPAALLGRAVPHPARVGRAGSRPD